MDRRLVVALGACAALAEAALWHGPSGAGQRFAEQVDARARATLDDLEMGQVQARTARNPIRRQLLLSGPADDFQRGELVRIMSDIPGVGSVKWVKRPESNGATPPPLIAEAMALSLAGFLIGLVLAYLVQWRRRANAQWRW